MVNLWIAGLAVAGAFLLAAYVRRFFGDEPLFVRPPRKRRRVRHGIYHGSIL